MLIVFLVVAVGAAFAADDVANETVSLDEQDELIEIENDDSALEEVDESLGGEETQENLQASNTVTNDTFFNYFDDSGKLKEDVTSDELVFEGEFSNIPNVECIYINKPITLTGKDAVLNFGIQIDSGNVVINNFNINNVAKSSISLFDAPNVKIINNNITFINNDFDYMSAIYVVNSNYLTFQSNRLSFATTRIGNKFAEIIDSDYAVVENNDFTGTIYSIGYQNGAIHFDETAENVVFSNNNVTVLSMPSGVDTTSIAVVFKGRNVTLSGNNITVRGDTYSYAICALGSDSKIVDNTIMASSPVYACGVNLEGSNVTLVDNNRISAASDVSSYGIYSGMTNGGLTGVYSNNTIDVSGYFVVGVSMSSFDESVIDNTIVVVGNYTIGVGAGYCNAYDASWNPIQVPIKNRIVKGNTINSLGNNIGADDNGDYLFDYRSTGIKDVAGNLTVLDNTINSTNIGISASGADDIIIQFNKVYINTTLINSKLVYLIDSIGAFIDNNTFVAVVPSSGYQMGVLHFNEGSNDLVFSNNNVVVSAVELSSSMNAVVFAGKNVTLTGNIVSVGDDRYSYAICALGSDSKIVDNTIMASSPVYACGVNLEGSNVTLVDNNKIFAVSSLSEGASYGIYSGMTSGGLTGVYSNNTIDALGYFVVGVSMSSFDESVIDNTIVVVGNYTIGVGAGYCNAYDASWNPIEIPIKNRIVKGNTINSLGNNVGTNKSGDYLFDYQSTGIKDVAGNITIINNNIQSTGVYAIVLANKNATVTNNSLLAARTSGDFSIANKDNAVISGSSPEYKTILFASDLTKTEGSADQYVVTAMDENGNVIVNKTISISVNGATQNATTDEKGVAKFNIDLAAGTYAVKASFAGDKIYGQKSISNTITVNAKPAPNPPSPPSTPSTNKVTKKSVKITAKKKTFKAKTKTKKYTIIVKSGKKAVKGLKVTLKVKGKTYKATTNAKGKATFKIKNLKKKGKYTAKIKFAGNKLYNKAAKSVKITVKK